MEQETAIIILDLIKRGQSVDLEVPLYITANELVLALNTAYDLGINTDDIKNCYLKAERPIALLRGNRTLEEFGVRNGTRIHFAD
ncbi:MAG: EsaB/YukD family protein [Lachnospiraceae bacterium]